jgi:hypothetical protein
MRKIVCLVMYVSTSKLNQQGRIGQIVILFYRLEKSCMMTIMSVVNKLLAMIRKRV